MIERAGSNPGLEISSHKYPTHAGKGKETSSHRKKPAVKNEESPENPSDLAQITPETFDNVDPFEPDSNVRNTAYTPPPESEKGEVDKEWTIMVYMAGDNDLETFLVNNLKSLEKVGSSPRINILAELDRGASPKSPLTKWKGSRRFEIQKSDDATRITSPVAQDLGTVNMADPKHLSDFVQWGMKNYPAKHYLLILNDHGYGFMGAADDKGSNDTMTLPEMAEGIKDAEKATGKKIDILGFDACLMSDLEVAYELNDTADFMIASQEVIGSGGWPYGDFTEKGPSKSSRKTKGPGGQMPTADNVSYLFPQHMALSTFLGKAEKIIDNTGKLEPETLAKGIVAQCEKHVDTTPTMAAIRLGDPIQKIVDAVKSLGESIKTSEQKEEILEAVKKTQPFNKQAPLQNPYGDYRDLYDFCDKLLGSKELNDEKLRSCAEAVQKTLDEAIVFRTREDLLPEKYKGAHGISLYIPEEVGQTDYGYGVIKFQKDTGWLDSIKEVAGFNPNEYWEPLYKPPAIKRGDGNPAV